MNSLIIDCSNGMAVYVICDKGTFSFVDQNQKRHTDELLVSVDKLLSEAGLLVGDVQNICICIGPGSFTGIRVAISICKGLAVSGDVKVVCASNFDVLSYGHSENAYYLLDGFSEYIYVRKFENGAYFDSCERLSDFISMAKLNADFVVYTNSEKLQNKLIEAKIIYKNVENNIISCFKDKIANFKFTPINEISPIYLRASQAEIEREKKMSGNNE